MAVELGTDNIVELPKVTSTHTLGLKWSPSSDKLSATSNNGIVAIWDLSLNGVLTEVSTGIGEQILWDIAWSPDERFLGVGSEDGKVYVIDTNKAMVTQTFVEHANQVTSIDWASNDILISGSWDSTIRVWNAKLGKQVNKLTGHSSAITSIQWNSKKDQLISSSKDGVIRSWTLQHSRSSGVLSRNSRWMWDAIWLSDSNTIIAAGDERHLELVVGSGQPIQLSQFENRTAITRVRLDAEGKRFATASQTGIVKIFDVGTGVEQKNFNLNGAFVTDIAWSPDGNYLVTTDLGQLSATKAGTPDTLVWNIQSQEIEELNFNEFNISGNDLIKTFDIRSSDGNKTIVRDMSGGNQQKAIVAREIAMQSSLIIFVQPTRGLDIGAIENIHNKIRELRKMGKAILLISLELDEVMSLADRIAVVYDGDVVGIVPGPEATEKELGIMMAGGVIEKYKVK